MEGHIRAHFAGWNIRIDTRNLSPEEKEPDCEMKRGRVPEDS